MRTKLLTTIKELCWELLFKHDDDFISTHYYIDDETNLEEYRTKITELSIKIASIREDFSLEKANLLNQIKEMKSLIKSLKDSDSETKKPIFLNNEMPYVPKTKIVTQTEEKEISLQPTEIYTANSAVKNIVSTNNWKELYSKDKQKCAYDIWEYVIKAITYEYDKREDWRFSGITLAYAKGDCEDGTILFVDLCKEAGFKSNEIFNACGWVETPQGSFSHSYPILNYGSGWFIYETTLDTLPNEPMRFLGSKYGGEWGLSNWKFAGRLTNGKKQI